MLYKTYRADGTVLSKHDVAYIEPSKHGEHKFDVHFANLTNYATETETCLDKHYPNWKDFLVLPETSKEPKEMELTEKHEAILRKQLIELDKFAENTPDPTPHHSPGTKWWDGDFPAFPEDYPLDDREAIEQLRDATLHYMEDLVQEALCYSDKEHKWIEDPENPWAVAYCTEFKDNKHKFNDLLAYLDLEDDIPAYLA